MGSAVPNPTGFDEARSILDELQEAAEAAGAKGEDPDYEALLAWYRHQLAHCRNPERVRLYLLAYLVRCVMGNVPDYTRWDPLI